MATDRKTKVRRINVIVWLVIAVFLMICAYNAWSQNGPYTLFSFIASLTAHGGFCLVVGILVDEQIVKHFNNK